MPSTLFVDNQTVIVASWMNDVNNSVYNIIPTLAPINSPTFTGTVGGITATMVGAPSGSGTSTGTNTGDQTDIPNLGGVPASGYALSGANTNITSLGSLTNINGGQIGGLRNIFINGSYQISQLYKAVATTITAGAAINYSIDRWYTSCTGQNITTQQVTAVAPFPAAFQLLAGATGPTTTLHGTRLKGSDCKKAVGLPVTGTVGIICDVPLTVTWTAYYADALDNFSAKTQIATGTIAATASQADYNYTFNAGAFAGNGLCVEFTTGALTNGTGYVQYQGHQFEVGAIASSREWITDLQMLLLCQSYLWGMEHNNTGIELTGQVISTSYSSFSARAPVPMRTPPTGLVVSNVAHFSMMDAAGTPIVGNGVAFFGSGKQSVSFQTTVASGLVAGNATQIYINTAGGFIFFTGMEL